ncbi:MAG: hypothetical protein IRZ21_08520 [Thermoleophilaceae bacterium]|nr:hypothetical protein [Thermoleophilaceae bacterium]
MEAATIAARTAVPLRARLARSLAVALAGGALVAAVAQAGGGAPSPSAVAAAATGDVRIADSRGGEAILSADALAPGDSASGSVTIANAGSATGDFSLSSVDVADAPGPKGGRLSEILQLGVSDAGGNWVYRGTLAAMRDVPLGRLAPGAARTYRFTVTLPASAGNAYMGSAVSTGFRWRADAVPDGAPLPPPPPSSPAAAGAGATERVRRTIPVTG